MTQGGDHTEDRVAKHLARVRALLAKAESTTFDEEAEALTAKAQELISKYSLEELLGAATGGRSGIVSRQIGLDAPYISAKATLLGAVARANRCTSIFSPASGHCTVVGAEHDVLAVDLLTTSLLAQAEGAVRRQGAAVRTGHGPSRTKSYRRAFLLSFAVRIGERLAEASSTAERHSASADRLLPVLAKQEAQVAAHVRELFPHLAPARRTTVTNLAGWAAGRVAADLAGLSANRPLR